MEVSAMAEHTGSAPGEESKVTQEQKAASPEAREGESSRADADLSAKQPEGESSRADADQPVTQPEGESSRADADQPDTEPEGAQAVPVGALPTGDLLVWMLSILAAKAWEGMGLVPNPLTKKVEKNLDEARLAIDAYAAAFEVVRLRVEDQPRRDMESLLTTLRLNFVEKST
jgi:Domain of unknown function (DUF1844)